MTTKKPGFVTGPYGKLACQFVNWKDDNRARIVFAHGFSPGATMVEHAKLFLQTAENAASLGVGSLLFDFSGNGSSDGYFHQLTPNGRIAEMSIMLKYASAAYEGPLFALGFSMGGAVSVYATAARQPPLAGLVTWSCVPSFDLAAASSHWHPQKPEPELVTGVGQGFFDDRPATDVGAIYQTLAIPKLQIQGDADHAFFAREFRSFYDKSPDPKRLVIVHGADHVFSKRSNRDELIDTTLDWIGSLLA